MTQPAAGQDDAGGEPAARRVPVEFLGGPHDGLVDDVAAEHPTSGIPPLYHRRPIPSPPRHDDTPHAAPPARIAVYRRAARPHTDPLWVYEYQPDLSQ